MSTLRRSARLRKQGQQSRLEFPEQGQHLQDLITSVCIESGKLQETLAAKDETIVKLNHTITAIRADALILQTQIDSLIQERDLLLTDLQLYKESQFSRPLYHEGYGMAEGGRQPGRRAPVVPAMGGGSNDSPLVFHTRPVRYQRHR